MLINIKPKITDSKSLNNSSEKIVIDDAQAYIDVLQSEPIVTDSDTENSSQFHGFEQSELFDDDDNPKIIINTGYNPKTHTKKRKFHTEKSLDLTQSASNLTHSDHMHMQPSNIAPTINVIR